MHSRNKQSIFNVHRMLTATEISSLQAHKRAVASYMREKLAADRADLPASHLLFEKELTVSKPAVHCDPDIMGGIPVFVGTRVPFKNLFDYLESGKSLPEFLEDFPSVSRELAIAGLEQVRLTAVYPQAI
jgi:uncharacterized protein (DUF433 family)